MPNLVQLQDAHIATDHSVTRERAIEIQHLVYKSQIKSIRYQDMKDVLGVDCDKELFHNYKKKMAQCVCIGSLANREVLSLFKNCFTDAEMTILLKFAKPQRIRSNSVVTNVEVNKVSQEDLRKVKKIRRQMMYLELYSKGL